ncbi:hypothetical protein DFP72DRAFT_939354 [Ephemerocybe angulata]|uniref:Uncharacterized protein n=1 Tax=Ephemerocybe angulata TaxID=980116 RepID=A0A8H6H858_9AGAR|nr:hypothetical protein DFP72DRAFT_939354 [Tulosesus angulatus]
MRHLLASRQIEYKYSGVQFGTHYSLLKASPQEPFLSYPSQCSMATESEEMTLGYALDGQSNNASNPLIPASEELLPAIQIQPRTDTTSMYEALFIGRLDISFHEAWSNPDEEYRYYLLFNIICGHLDSRTPSPKATSLRSLATAPQWAYKEIERIDGKELERILPDSESPVPGEVDFEGTITSTPNAANDAISLPKTPEKVTRFSDLLNIGRPEVSPTPSPKNGGGLAQLLGSHATLSEGALSDPGDEQNQSGSHTSGSDDRSMLDAADTSHTEFGVEVVRLRRIPDASTMLFDHEKRVAYPVLITEIKPICRFGDKGLDAAQRFRLGPKGIYAYFHQPPVIQSTLSEMYKVCQGQGYEQMRCVFDEYGCVDKVKVIIMVAFSFYVTEYTREMFNKDELLPLPDKEDVQFVFADPKDSDSEDADDYVGRFTALNPNLYAIWNEAIRIPDSPNNARIPNSSPVYAEVEEANDVDEDDNGDLSAGKDEGEGELESEGPLRRRGEDSE